MSYKSCTSDYRHYFLEDIKAVEDLGNIIVCKFSMES